MLKTLTVNNFALIEQVSVDFISGLTILTGETGAGKSILIDALNTVLGSRASNDFIRSGSEQFRVEAVFDIHGNGLLEEQLESQGITPEEDGSLIISRFLNRSGKSAIHINGCQVTLGILRQFGALLVDMHGQHENQTLLKPESYLSLLDSYDPTIVPRLEAYREIYLEWHQLCRDIERLELDSRERAQRLDMLEWQTKEIAAATLTPGEDEKLEADIRVLTHAEKIRNAVAQAHALLSEGDKGAGSILSALAETKREIEHATRFDEKLQSCLATVTDTLYLLEEAAIELRDYGETIEYNPGRLVEMQQRMDVIHKLKKKYGPTVQEVLAFYEQAVGERDEIAHYEEHFDELTKRRQMLEQQLAKLAEELDLLRKASAERLSTEVARHLQDLAMPKARLMIDVRKTDRYLPLGNNEVVISFSANPGEDPKPLHKIASGGELSRIALAIKTEAASRDMVGTMVFDEIDAGISGQAAQMVGDKIAWVAQGKQVLCITHLPQIAAMADNHIRIEKQVEGDRTTTHVKPLIHAERLGEVARMISGDNLTKLALENAAEMIATAKSRKEKWKNKAQA